MSGLSQAVSEPLPQSVPTGAAGPAVHWPAWHESFCVQMLPSLQVTPFATLEWTHVSLPVSGRFVVLQPVAPASVPLFPPTESTARLPEPSLKLHRCTRPGAEAISRFMSAAISAVERA